MTISSSPARVSYAGNGVTTAFSWNYPLFDDDDIIVIDVDADGVETVKTKTTHYTVSIADGYGSATVTMLTAPASGHSLVLVRKSAPVQIKDLSAATVVDLDEIEENFDRFVVMIQDLQAEIDRAPKTSIGSATTNLTLPEPEAGKVIGWNDDEDDLENREPPAWVTGAAAPDDDADGSVGDMYLRTTTGEVYGPKTASGWGSVVADITGDTGPAGANGAALAWQGDWQTATGYTANQAVANGGASYICTSPHTSDASTEPGVGASWTTVWDVLSEKGDTGAAGPAGNDGADGADGATGPAGADGADGTDGVTPAIRQTYSTTTADADPGSGKFRLNNATIASATAAYVDNNEIGGSAINAWLDTFDDSTSSVKGYLILMGVTTLTHFAIFAVSGSVVDGTGYRKLTLTYVTGNATAGAWTNNDVFSLLFMRAGDKGDTGAAGAGTGDVVGPGSAVDGHFAIFDGATGKLLKDTLAAPGALATKDTVGTAQIDADSVTYAKIQNISATSRFLGRKTAGAGDTEELTGSDAATIIGCYTPGGTDVALADGGTGASLSDPNADRIMFWDDSAGQVTWLVANTGLAISGTNLNVDLGKQSIWIPAAAMTPRTTNGAASGTVEMATNKNMFSTLDFDTTTQEFAQFAIRMPKSWNEGTVTFIPVWSHAATVTNFGVVWALQAVAISDDDAGDVAFGTEQTSTDTGGTTNDVYQGPESSAITVSGTPAAGDLVMFQLKRNPSDGSDTLAVDARLHGILVLYTIDTLKDD